MIKYTTPLHAEFRHFYKKVRSSFRLKVILLFAIGFGIFASIAAQSINYDLPQYWMCHPVLKSTDVARQQDLTLSIQNKNLLIDSVLNYNMYSTPATNTGVDIFYIYPTIDMHRVLGNTNIDSIDTKTAKFVYREQVGIYAQFGRVFVPYYRQAKIGVFLDTNSADTALIKQTEYLLKAYHDVEAAFDNYYKNYNNGNKIILMGHSQGAYLMRFLLRKRFDNDPVLKSKLVVAISGGEPNYVAIGSRTGGSLENIKTLGMQPESGCMINWRTWKSGTKVQLLQKNSFFYNKNFVDSGLIYQNYDSIKHQESSYDFGYVTHKLVTRYITLSPDSTRYLGFDDMFNACVTPPGIIKGSTYLLIDKNIIPNDLRVIPNITFDPLFPTIPIPETNPPYNTPNNNYHCWDMQFVQGDLLTIIPELIKVTFPYTSVPIVTNSENTIRIYPNPTNQLVHLSNIGQNIKNIRLCNSKGEFIEEYFTNDFSVSNLPEGIYFIITQTNKSTFTNKLVKL